MHTTHTTPNACRASKLLRVGRFAGPSLFTSYVAALLLRRVNHDFRIFTCSAGAASSIGGTLTSLPGASEIFLGGHIPYDSSLLANFIGRGAIETATSQAVAISMANESYLRGQEALVRAGKIKNGKPTVVGLGLTADIASTTRSGENQMHIAIRTFEGIASGAVVLEKGHGRIKRELQNATCEDIALNALCVAIGAKPRKLVFNNFAMPIGQVVDGRVQLAPLAFPAISRRGAELINEEGAIASLSSLSPDRHIIYPGSFRSFHCGHDLAALSAQSITNKKVVIEISGANMDKDPVPWDELLRRATQFRGRYPVIVRQDAPSFLEKAIAYGPGWHFVCGFDTATRILNPSYYEESWDKLEAALDHFDTHNNHFYILGRSVPGADAQPKLQTHRNLWGPFRSARLFHGLAGQLDVSASGLLGAE